MKSEGFQTGHVLFVEMNAIPIYNTIQQQNQPLTTWNIKSNDVEPSLTFSYPDRLLTNFTIHWKVFILMNLHGMTLVIIRLLAKLASLFRQTLRSTTLLKVPTNLNKTVIIVEKRIQLKHQLRGQ